MRGEEHEEALDLRREDIDVSRFAAALAVRYVCRLIANGGREYLHPDLEEGMRPHDLASFLVRAVTAACETGHFQQTWQQCQRAVPALQRAWEQGQTCFQEDLTRAQEDPEEMDYLEQVDMAMDCYAYACGLNLYPNTTVLQNWLISGYMLAWRRHFLPVVDDEGDI